MKLERCYALLLVVFMIMGIALSGCNTAEAGFSEVYINLGDEPSTLDPQLAYDVVPMNVINAVFEGLLRKDKDGTPIPGVAKKWVISEDRLTYTFYLKDDAAWWDGTDVTAQNFKDAWMRALDPQPEYHEPSYMCYLLFCIKGAEEYAYGEGKAEDVAIYVKDEKTLSVTLSEPTPYFTDLVCNSVYMPINTEFFKKQISEDSISRYGSEAENLLGNGPFRIEEWNHDQSIVLTRNDMYWNSENIQTDGIKFRMIGDNTAAINSFKAGEIDMVEITDPLLMQEFNSSDYQIGSYNAGIVQYISMNNEDPILGNVNIRKALSYAIERKTLVEKVLGDGSTEALGFVSPVVKGEGGHFRQKAGELFKDDIEKAKELLKQGLKELKLSQMPKLSILVDDKETSKRDAQVFQDMWRKNLGVDVEIEIMSFDAMTEKMMRADYQMSLLMWSGDYNDPRAYLEVFSSSNFYNVAYYVNLYFDELLEKSIEEADSKKRMDLLVEAEKIVINDMPVCPIYFAQNSYAVNSRIKGLVRGSSAIQDIDLYWTYIE